MGVMSYFILTQQVYTYRQTHTHTHTHTHTFTVDTCSTHTDIQTNKHTHKYICCMVSTLREEVMDLGCETMASFLMVMAHASSKRDLTLSSLLFSSSSSSSS